MNYKTWEKNTRYRAGVTVKAVLDGITSYHKCRVPHISADPYDVTNTAYWIPVAEPKQKDSEGVVEKQSQALALLAMHPDWTNKQIAAAMNVHPKTLSRSRMPEVDKVRELLRAARNDRSRR